MEDEILTIKYDDKKGVEVVSCRGMPAQLPPLRAVTIVDFWDILECEGIIVYADADGIAHYDKR